MTNEAIRRAVNFAILTAHRLGEPRVLELPRDHLRQLQLSADPADWSLGPNATYRGLRVAETTSSFGWVLAWDRVREMEMAQRIDLPA